MKTHFLPRFVEARYYLEGSAINNFENRQKYKYCFNVTICGTQGFVSGIDEFPGFQVIRDVKNFLKRNGCNQMNYEKRGRSVSMPLKNKSNICILPNDWEKYYEF